jgi:CheY-like chemotaxis protein
MNILIVEDNLAHQKITEYVLKHNKVSGKFFVVRDGQDALDYLFHKNGYADAEAFPTPDLILLDLNLPKRDGREVLKMVKEHPDTRDVPVVIVSTSDREEDVAYAMQTGAAAYISKSSGFDKFNQELSSVLVYARKP